MSVRLINALNAKTCLDLGFFFNYTPGFGGNMKGAIIYYLNIGQLPPVKVDAYIKKQTKGLKVFIQKLKQKDLEFIVIPTRDRATSMEVLPLTNAFGL